MEEKIIPINAALKEAISSKSGKSYLYVEVQLTPNCPKKVFLEPSELELIKLAYFKNEK